MLGNASRVYGKCRVHAANAPKLRERIQPNGDAYEAETHFKMSYTQFKNPRTF